MSDVVLSENAEVGFLYFWQIIFFGFQVGGGYVEDHTEHKRVSNVNLRYAMQLQCLIEHIVCMRRIVVQVPLWSVE